MGALNISEIVNILHINCFLPIVIDTGKGLQVITVASPWVIAYDPADGREIWKYSMEGPDIAPSPTFAGGLVFVIVPNYDVTAIRTDGSGDVTKTHAAWMFDESAPDTCSPVVPELDIEGHPRADGTDLDDVAQPDMGAYERQP